MAEKKVVVAKATGAYAEYQEEWHKLVDGKARWQVDTHSPDVHAPGSPPRCPLCDKTVPGYDV